ncbi:hypothetical protein BDY19DRAFT_995483 [Irpex rosettiformis]|uniref:Uncharacterized protein n=1 Tax=Irpex rosettiformis TaxID=378272 RepID=A0ACB8TXZ6_9APHY|nr:hypothetical protein BDY19DRAFT_995483 [Irpex rosettiformis]
MTCLYAFTRYSEVLSCINSFIPVWSWEAGQYTLDILDATQLFCLASFSALRVYALMDGKIIVTGIVFLLILVPVGTNLFLYVTNTIVMDSEKVLFYGVSKVVITHYNSSDTFRGSLWERGFLSLSVMSSYNLAVFDQVTNNILSVTWSKTAKLYYEARQLKIKAPLATLLFVTGHSTSFKPAGSSWISGSQSGSLRFVGNAGESLRFGVNEEEAEEENIIEDASEAREPDVLAVVRNESSGSRVDQDAVALIADFVVLGFCSARLVRLESVTAQDSE